MPISKYFKINDRIQARDLRVIDPEGKQIGILSREEALAKSAALGLDLIEIAPQAQPPVARIYDFQKFRYGENKKERAAKKHAKEVEVKEIWFSPRIAKHDLQVRLDKAEEFLKRGDKVKLTVKFRGREMIHPEAGHNVLNQVFAYFGDRVAIDREPKFEGRTLTAIIGLSKGDKKNAETKNQEVTS